MIDIKKDKIKQGFVLADKALVAEVFTKNGLQVLSIFTEEEQVTEVNAEQTSQFK